MELFPYIQQFFVDLFSILNEMSPYLLIGLFFAGLLKVFLPETFISKYLRKSNTKSAVNATLLGVPLPLCSCGVLPTGISLYKNGASKGATNAFITSTPQTGVDSILVTYAMLGLPMAIIRPVVALISGVLSGVVTNKVTKNEEKIEVKTSEKISCAEHRKSFAQRWVEVFRYAFITFLSDIARWLVIGLLIAALISVALPEDFFTTYIYKGIVGILLTLIASMPLYICATASVPIAAVLLSKGISPGAILVFLMAGPATNAASFTLIGKTLGKRSLIAYLGTIIFAAVSFGLFIDAFLPVEWFRIGNFTHTHTHGKQNWQFWLQTASTIILIGLILYIYLRKYNEKQKTMTISKDERLFQILAKKSLLIKGTISAQKVEEIVKDLGFTYEGQI